MAAIQYVGLVEKWFQRRGNDQKVHHTGFQRTKLPTTLDACVYTASRFKGAVFSAVLSRRNVLRFRMLSKRLLSSLQELALSLRFLGACLRFPFFRWIPFSPLNTCHLTAVPKNRRIQCTRCRFVLTFFRVRSHSFSHDPVSAFQWTVKNSPTRIFLEDENSLLTLLKGHTTLTSQGTHMCQVFSLIAMTWLRVESRWTIWLNTTVTYFPLTLQKEQVRLLEFYLNSRL